MTLVLLTEFELGKLYRVKCMIKINLGIRYSKFELVNNRSKPKVSIDSTKIKFHMVTWGCRLSFLN